MRSAPPHKIGLPPPGPRLRLPPPGQGGCLGGLPPLALGLTWLPPHGEGGCSGGLLPTAVAGSLGPPVPGWVLHPAKQKVQL